MQLIRDGEKARTFLVQDLTASGFDAVGVTRPETVPQLPDRLRRFLEDGHHGTMDWMQETEARRADPKVLWPEVTSIIMVTMNYGPEPGTNVLSALERREAATISLYARNRDYHDVMKGLLKQAAGRFAARTGAQVKVFVDTAPVMEKPLAQAAGLGWQGKHTNLVSRQTGSWFFLGAIFTDFALPADTAEADHCGSCTNCLDICPTNAFPAPYRLDARRCISYLTIEHAGPIDTGLRRAMGNRIYGCDDCLAVCPWNKFASAAREARLAARADLTSPLLADLLAFDDATFRQHFSGSPVKRIGRNRFIRNCLIAAGNAASVSLVAPVLTHLDDPDPVVRGAAVWALSQLDPPRFESERALRYVAENDAVVRNEWDTPQGIEGHVT